MLEEECPHADCEGIALEVLSQYRVRPSRVLDSKKPGLEHREIELTNHTGVIVGTTRSTIGRHTEIAAGTARAFVKQFEQELGKGWWR